MRNYQRIARGLRNLANGFVLAGTVCIGSAAIAQTEPTTQPATATQPTETNNQWTTLPSIMVTAEKQAEPLQDTPLSVTALSGQQIEDSGITDLRDAAYYAPNVLFSNFSATRETFPFIRGIGSGQNSPAVTTYYDGVPQLSFSTANLELYDIDRIEFLRGPQGTLYGRNAEGGVINVYSRQPTNDLHASTDFMVGSYGLQDYRGAVSGAIIPDKLYLSFSGGFSQRQGYTINNFDNLPLDGVNHLFGRFQLLWTPTKELDVRLMVNAERDHDGDFPLYDLASLRANPLRVDHDFTGMADRDVNQDALVINYHGKDVDVVSISAYQQWSSNEATDLDETALPLLQRSNLQSEHNLVQELRASNPADKPLVLSHDAKLKWLIGLFAFQEDSESFITNATLPEAVPVLGVPFAYSAFTDSSIDYAGVGLFGDTTLTLWNKLDLTAGLRYDYEHAHGDIANTNSTPLIPGNTFVGSRDFDQLSPRIELGYHWTPDLFTYASATKGYKAGGFNATSPEDKTIFSPETSWDYELGAKTSWLKNHLIINADLFYIDWSHQQLDVPTGEPSVYYIDNVGSSTSKGAELEATIRPVKNWDIFGGIGYTNAQFSHYLQPSGVSANGNQLPFAPNITWNFGSQYTLPLSACVRTWVRADVLGTGRYFYDASNAASQSDYIVSNFRLGVGGDNWRLEGFIDNAFNTHYVPIAYPFPLAASGYVGESGAPQTVGMRLGFSY